MTPALLNIINTPEFAGAVFSKYACVPIEAMTPAEYEVASVGMAHGLLDYLKKDAGLNDDQTANVLLNLMAIGMGASEGIRKQAEGGGFWNTVLHPVDTVNTLTDRLGRAQGAGFFDRGWERVSGALGKAKDWIMDPNNIQKWAPSVIGGLGAFGASKAMGAGTGTALLAGAAGAAAPVAWNAYQQHQQKGKYDTLRKSIAPGEHDIDDPLASGKKPLSFYENNTSQKIRENSAIASKASNQLNSLPPPINFGF